MKVLISSRSYGLIDSGSIEMLKEAGFEVVMNPHGRKLNENELIELIDEDTVGIIAGTEKITSKVIEHSSGLKVISRYGVGLDNVDLEAAKAKGVVVRNTPEAPSLAVAELTLTLILNLLRKTSAMDRKIRSTGWKAEMGNLLSGKSIGIIGLGRIGKAFVKLTQPFHVKFSAYEPNFDDSFATEYNVESVNLKKLITENDIITLHSPLTEDTKYIIGNDELSQMKPNTLIINTARGGLVDETALVEALENKEIAGAAIDAFEAEPYEGKLKEFDNVILSPHVGSLTEETRISMEIETVENLISSLKELKIL